MSNAVARRAAAIIGPNRNVTGTWQERDRQGKAGHGCTCRPAEIAVRLSFCSTGGMLLTCVAEENGTAAGAEECCDLEEALLARLIDERLARFSRRSSYAMRPAAEKLARTL